METEEFDISKFVKKEYEIEHNYDKFLLEVYIKRKVDDPVLLDKLKNVASENEVSDNIYKIVRNNSKSIGMVFYMEKGYSKNTEENLDIHIPYINEKFYPKIIQLFIEDLLEIKLEQIIVGHEHGDKEKKCHLQTCLKFNKNLYKILKPGFIKIKNLNTEENVKLLFLQQKTRNIHALMNYCKKEKDFEYLFDEQTIEFKTNKKGNVEIFETVIANKDLLSKSEAEDLIMRYNPSKFFLSYNNIQKAIDNVFKEKLPDFEWQTPYIPEDYTVPTKDGRTLFKPIFESWFNNYCLVDDIRKKALCLYSEKRALGKTTFARSLVNDPGYILEYNNLFNDQNLKTRANDLKLLLLDDMTLNSSNYAIWKALVAGEKTTIRAFFCSDTYDLNLPCIITTNDLNMLTTFVKDSNFNTQVICVEIDTYLGPPETLRDDLCKKEFYLSQKLLEDVDQNEADMDKKKLNKF